MSDLINRLRRTAAVWRQSVGGASVGMEDGMERLLIDAADALTAKQSAPRQPIESAPRDGTSIVIPIALDVQVFWCNEMKTWVLDHPLIVETLSAPKEWIGLARHEQGAGTT